jgi:nucleoside-diphosphate-sugar epimerase
MDFAGLIDEHRPDFVINAAAMTPAADVDGGIVARTIDVNVVSTVALLEAARTGGVRRFFQPSSTSVYGTAVHGSRPLLETDSARPDDIYSVSKYAAESIALRFASVTGLDVVVGRISALFGRWERNTGVRERLSPQRQILELAASGRQIVVDRRACRDWTPAEDVAEAIIALLNLGGPTYRLYNLSCGFCWPLELWLMALSEIWDGLSWRFAEPGEASNLVYHDTLDRVRQPLDITRLRAEGLCDGVPPLTARIEVYARHAILRPDPYTPLAPAIGAR